jgi:hypothetical protein
MPGGRCPELRCALSMARLHHVVRTRSIQAGDPVRNAHRVPVSTGVERWGRPNR